MSDQPCDADAEEVAALIHTALYDTGGELVEGGFVDRWEPNALTAIDDLARLFERRGFTAADEALLRSAVTDPRASNEAAVTLLTGLRNVTRPLLEELHLGESAGGRAAAVRALSAVKSPAEALSRLQDPSPLVRLAAVKAVIEQRRNLAEANARIIDALNDGDPNVRLEAARAIDFWSDPRGSGALLRRYGVEETASVRRAILSHIIESVRREGTHCGPDRLRERVGREIQAFLLTQLAHPEPEVRYEAARALERLACEEVGRIFLRRLEEESDLQCRRGLLYYRAFHHLADEALPILMSLLSDDPDPGVRAGVAFAVEWLGAPVVSHLVKALDDPHENVRRAAAMSLGKCRAGRALPRLLRELWDQRNWRNDREFASAVRDVAFYVPGPSTVGTDAGLSAEIQARIDALDVSDPRGWPQRVCQEEFDALPLHASLIYQWCLRPDGTVFCWDHEAVRRGEEPETDPRTRFAVLVHGAIRFPELTPLIPKLPENVRLCDYCLGRGWQPQQGGGNEPCMSCNCLGWIERQ